MTTTLDMQKSGKFSLDNKVIALAVTVYSVIEAIFAYLFFFKPLYIDPVYLKCDEYNAEGITCLVKLFGKSLATSEEIENNQVILSLWDTISNMLIIYLIIFAVGIVLAFCIFKGMSFAKTYFVAFFGGKHVIGIMGMLIPMANMRRSTMIFGIIDAVFCIVLCLYFITLTNDEYADDMLLTPEQIGDMNKRMKLGFILYGGMLLFSVFERYAISALGKNRSLLLDWTTNSTAVTQGIVIAALLAVALICAVIYIKDADVALYFFTAFGTAAAVSNIVALIGRVTWVTGTYNRLKPIYESGNMEDPEWASAELVMTTSGGVDVIGIVFTALAAVASAVVAVLAFMKLSKSLKFKFDAADKKPALAVIVTAGCILLAFVFTVVALTLFIGQRNPAAALGAMDYFYFIVYGGVSLFLALAMWGGFGFTKFGALALFLVTAASNFGTIFTVLEHRRAYIDAQAAAGMIVQGYNHLIAVVMLVLSIVCCFSIIIPFVVKGVSDYMYQKRFS